MSVEDMSSKSRPVTAYTVLSNLNSRVSEIDHIFVVTIDKEGRTVISAAGSISSMGHALLILQKYAMDSLSAQSK